MRLPATAAALFLSASSLFASADLAIFATSSATSVRGGLTFTGLTLTLINQGPDTAKDVKIALTGVTASCTCDIGDVLPGHSLLRTVAIEVPTAAGPFTITATVTSSTPDDVPANNTVSKTLNASTDPDLQLNLTLPATQDVGLPFALGIQLVNLSKSDAHDAVVTIDFRPDVVVASLRAECTNPSAGRIVCRTDLVAAEQQKNFTLGLVAPPLFGDGSIVFQAEVVEAEHDFDLGNNARIVTITLNRTFLVTMTTDDGTGSLRQAILNANLGCTATSPCSIVFHIEGPSPNPWKTIHILSPLPAITGPAVRIDGSTQGTFTGKHNPNGPDIEISGSGDAGNGLVLSTCSAEVSNLAVNGFPGNGISVTSPPPGQTCTFSKLGVATLHDLFVGTDPTGTTARPNRRGIGTSFANGVGFNNAGPTVTIYDCVISGNTQSGIFALTGRLNVTYNRIGVEARSDSPLPNGNAGVYVGPGCYGSDIGAGIFSADNHYPPDTAGNVIAFNGQMGIAVAAGVGDVQIRNNRIWGNGGQGIDIGLDGPNQPAGAIPAPVLTAAHYDPVTNTTIIDGHYAGQPAGTFAPFVDLFANDAPDPSGFGEGQRPLGNVRVIGGLDAAFTFSAPGNLTGQFITATATRLNYVGFAKPGPDGIEQGFLTQTSEFGRAIEVR